MVCRVLGPRDGRVVKFVLLRWIGSLSAASIVVSARVALVPMSPTYPVMPDVATTCRTRGLGPILIKIEGGGTPM